MKLGKQARDDGAFESENVLGDMVEALIGALWLDAGFEAAKAFIRAAWADRRAARSPRTAPGRAATIGPPAMSGVRDELCGRTVGDFVLRERIGEGAYGAVYLVRVAVLVVRILLVTFVFV